jgi:hypothetical protein
VRSYQGVDPTALCSALPTDGRFAGLGTEVRSCQGVDPTALCSALPTVQGRYDSWDGESPSQSLYLHTTQEDKFLASSLRANYMDRATVAANEVSVGFCG